MPQTLAQKFVARASATPGETVTRKVDPATMRDSGGPRRVRPMPERLGAWVRDPAGVVVATDRDLPVRDGGLVPHLERKLRRA